MNASTMTAAKRTTKREQMFAFYATKCRELLSGLSSDLDYRMAQVCDNGPSWVEMETLQNIATELTQVSRKMRKA